MPKKGLRTNIKKITVVEFSGHHEVVSTVVKMFISTEIEVQIFCNYNIYNFCTDLHPLSGISWFINKTINHNLFLKDSRKTIAKSDLVLITTIDAENRTFVDVNWPVPSFAIVHDLYITFEPFKNLMEHFGFNNRSFLRLLKYVKSILTRENKYRQSAIDKIDHLLLPSNDIYIHAKSKSWFKGSKILGILPFYTSVQTDLNIKNETLRIVVPGTVSNKSRDYHLLFDTVSQIKFPYKTEIILLGIPYLEEGKAILKKFNYLKINNLKIVSFTKEIEQSKYDNILKSSDFIIAPLKKYMDYIYCRERTGYSCISGNINDIVKFGTPALLPKFFPVDKDVSLLVDQYANSDEFVSLLQDWIDLKIYSSKAVSFATSSHNITPKQRCLSFINLVEMKLVITKRYDDY